MTTLSPYDDDKFILTKSKALWQFVELKVLYSQVLYQQYQSQIKDLHYYLDPGICRLFLKGAG